MELEIVIDNGTTPISLESSISKEVEIMTLDEKSNIEKEKEKWALIVAPPPVCIIPPVQKLPSTIVYLLVLISTGYVLNPRLKKNLDNEEPLWMVRLHISCSFFTYLFTSSDFLLFETSCNIL